MSDQERKTEVTPSGKIVFIKNLFEPNEDGKRTGTLILNKDQNVKGLKNLMLVKAREKFDEKQIKSPKMQWGLKKPSDESIEQYDFMDEDTLVLNAGTKFEIEVKSKDKGPDGKLEDLIDGDLKAGDFCRFLVSAYCWEYKGKYGVSLNLTAVQFIKEGEALYSRVASDNAFDEVEVDIEVEETQAEASGEVDGDDAFEF